ncbi:MAG: hypothetical protein ACXW2G_01375 [Burkholderiaceae bacterium]
MNRIIAMCLLLLAGVFPAQAQQAAGLSWTAPTAWKSQGERPMRVATYTIPAAKGDKEPAELAVFFFGQGQGGPADANVKRWVDQFRKADGSSAESAAAVKKETLAGLPATTLDLKGTYVGGGPQMGGGAPKPGFRLLGAIVEGPGGNLYFKLTGPEKTVADAAAPFRKMLEGIKKK